MPSKSAPFTPSSILFRPRNQVIPVSRLSLFAGSLFPGPKTREKPAISDRNRSARTTFAGFSPMTDDWPLPWKLVEAPGTAPGSEWFIPTAIYRHSRQAGALNIGGNGRRRKSRRRFCSKKAERRIGSSADSPAAGSPARSPRRLPDGTFYRGRGRLAIMGCRSANLAARSFEMAGMPGLAGRIKL
jgi:hypothetical protein